MFHPRNKHHHHFRHYHYHHFLILLHYCDVIMSPTVSQITSLTIVSSIVYSGTDQRKHQSSASLAFVRGIHWRPVNSPHKWPVTRKMFPIDDVIMETSLSEFKNYAFEITLASPRSKCVKVVILPLLTHSMFDCFNDNKRYINILNRIMHLAWPKQMKSNLE